MQNVVFVPLSISLFRSGVDNLNYWKNFLVIIYFNEMSKVGLFPAVIKTTENLDRDGINNSDFKIQYHFK